MEEKNKQLLIMPKPYSYDLRSKAINAFKSGKKKIEVCRYFTISRNTLDLWLKKEKETGDYQPKKPIGKGTKSKIEDREKFTLFVEENKGKTQKEMARLWGNKVTQQNISYACKKLEITRKKKLMVIQKEMKKKGENLGKN
jgi:transposase